MDTVLPVLGMTCETCARRVETALNTLDGVTALVSHDRGTATIRAAERVDFATLERAVAAAGYRLGTTDSGVQGASVRTADGTGLHIAVVGSGGAAFAAAIRAAEAGARVTLVERGTLGGTCVNVGCVPSKILLRAGEMAHQANRPAFAGLPTSGGTVDRHSLIEQLRARVDGLRHDKYETILDDDPAITLVRGHAHFEDAATLAVETPDDGTVRVAADRILLATGATPAVPPIPGLDGTPWWSSTDALFAEAAPEHLVVIGSSFVAAETAQAFRRLGSEVTILARGRLLTREAPEVGQALAAAFEDDEIQVLEDTQARHVDHDGQRFTITTDDERLRCDALIAATGRIPDTGDLGLERIALRTDARGAIEVDERLRTSVGNVYAAGDCTDLPQLVYVAAAAGTRAAINMTGGHAALDLSVVPSVIFTDPQVGSVGHDEAEAEAAGIRVTSRRLPLDQVPRALANFDTRGFVRLIAETATGRILGARVVAPGAGEVIETAALAIRAGMTVDALAGELFPYLTLSESLKLCAQTFRRDVSRLSCCAG